MLMWSASWRSCHPIRTTDGLASVLVHSETSTAAASVSADYTIRGSASNLFLFLWNRIGRSSIDVEGDARVLDVWRDTARL